VIREGTSGLGRKLAPAERTGAVAGAQAKGAFHCDGCGYGVTVYSRLPRCPMCGGETWRRALWRPLSRALEEPSEAE
jgi:hypothetical protein